MPLLLFNGNFNTAGSLAPFVLTAGTVAQTTGTADANNAHTGTGFARFTIPTVKATSTISATLLLTLLPPGSILRLSFAGRYPKTPAGTTSVTATVLVNGILPVATISIPTEATPDATIGNYEYYEGFSIPLPPGVISTVVTISFTSTAAGDMFDIDDVDLYLDIL